MTVQTMNKINRQCNMFLPFYIQYIYATFVNHDWLSDAGAKEAKRNCLLTVGHAIGYYFSAI